MIAEMAMLVLTTQWGSAGPGCLAHLHMVSGQSEVTIGLLDKRNNNSLSITKNSEIGMYCIDKYEVVHAQLNDCSEMTNGFCNGHLYIDGRDFGLRKETQSACSILREQKLRRLKYDTRTGTPPR